MSVLKFSITSAFGTRFSLRNLQSWAIFTILYMPVQLQIQCHYCEVSICTTPYLVCFLKCLRSPIRITSINSFFCTCNPGSTSTIFVSILGSNILHMLSHSMFDSMIVPRAILVMDKFPQCLMFLRCEGLQVTGSSIFLIHLKSIEVI